MLLDSRSAPANHQTHHQLQKNPQSFSGKPAERINKELGFFPRDSLENMKAFLSLVSHFPSKKDKHL
jgi:hypothetical protein